MFMKVLELFGRYRCMYESTEIIRVRARGC